MFLISRARSLGLVMVDLLSAIAAELHPVRFGSSVNEIECVSTIGLVEVVAIPWFRRWASPSASLDAFFGVSHGESLSAPLPTLLTSPRSPPRMKT